MQSANYNDNGKTIASISSFSYVMNEKYNPKFNNPTPTDSKYFTLLSNGILGLTTDQTLVTEFKNTVTDLVIPNEINGNPVTQIGGVYNNNLVISTTNSQNNGMNIQLMAAPAPSSTNLSFNGCENIKSVYIYNGITTIHKTFSNCANLESIRIPNSIEFFEDDYSGCPKLKYLVTDDNCKYLGNNDNSHLVLYSVDSAITTFEMMKDTKIIRYDSFYNHSNLTSLKLNDSIDFYNDFYTLEDSSGQLNVIVDEKNKNYSSDDGAIYTKDGTILLYVPKGKTLLKVKDTIKSVSLDPSINNPNINIGNSWLYTDSTTGAKYLGNDTNNYMILYSVDSSITSFVVKAETKNINKVSSIFRKCTNLTQIDVDTNNVNYSSDDGVLYNKEETELLYVPSAKSSLKIKDTIISIDSDIPDNCLYTDSTTGAKYLGNDTNNYMILYSVDSSSTSFNLNKDTKIIYDITSIFDECTNLTEISVDTNNLNYSSYDGVLYNKEETELLYVPSAKSSLKIKDTIISIDSNIPDDCLYTDSQGAEYLGNDTNNYYALYSAIDLTNFEINKDTKIILSDSISNCNGISVQDGNTNFKVSNDCLMNADGTKIIYCFNFNITSFTISNDIQSISNSAFYDCGKLSQVLIDSENISNNFVILTDSCILNNCCNLYIKDTINPIFIEVKVGYDCYFKKVDYPNKIFIKNEYELYQRVITHISNSTL
jgi:hypothetical protein